MKLNRFYFAALAATMIASCSNEQDIVMPGSQNLKPGEALVTFDVRGKVTSRADAAQEKEIKSLFYKVYNSETKDSVAITRIPTSSPSMIQFKISSDIVKVMGGKTMHILAAVNSTNDLNYEKLADAQEATERKDLNAEFETAASGLPASADVTFTMTSGPITIAPTNKAKRIVSRIYVKKNPASTGNITGAVINVRNVANAAYLFKNEYITGTGNTINATTYTVKNEEAQPVAYVYPTSGASVDIDLNGAKQTVNIAKLDKNKNYAINIKTDVSTGDAMGSWSVALEEWDMTEEVIDAEITVTPGETVQLKGDFKVGNSIAVESGKLAVNVHGSSEIAPIDLFEGNIQLTSVTAVTGGQTRATALEGESSLDGVVQARVADGNLILTVENTKVGVDGNYSIELDAMVDGKQKNISLPIVAKGYPENFSVNINGVEIMTVGIQDRNGAIDPSPIIDIVKAVNQMDGGTFAAKSRAYVQQNQGLNEAKYMGIAIALPRENDCPRGFEVPTMHQIRQIFGVSSERLPVDPMGGNSVKTKITVNPGAPVTEGFNDYLGASGNSMEHLNTPHNHYIFRYQDDGQTKEFYIPRGDRNGISTPANNFIFSGSDNNTYTHGRFIVWSNEVQMRQATGNIVGSTNWLRCVKKASTNK